MAVLEAVAAEAAKVVSAEVVSVAIRGGKRLVKLIRDRVGGLPDREELERVLLDALRADPVWAQKIAVLVAETVEPRGTLGIGGPPEPYFDRDEARALAPSAGVFLISGMRGSGRISLARKIAAERADHFPFGAIEIDLDIWREGQALAFSQVKNFLLARLGVLSSDIAVDPRTLDQQLLSAMLTRRFLLILRNARGAGEIAAFAGAAVANLLIVTTAQLTDDLRMAYPRHVLLGRLEGRGGWQLLASRCGEAILQVNPPATEQLLDICDHMPRAITYVAAQLQRRRGRPDAVADLVAHLDAVGAGNSEGAVRQALDETFSALPADVLAGCALLASHPGPDFTVEGASALLGYPAWDLIDRLTDAGMLSTTGTGRLRMHHAARRYAAGSVNSVDADAGFLRFLDYQCDRAVAADFADDANRLRRYPERRDLQPVQAPVILAALDQDRAMLLSLAREATRRGYHNHVCQLGGALEVLVNKRGGYQWYAALNEQVIASADALHEQEKPLALVARVHMMQARMYTLMNVFDRAKAELDTAWPLVADSADDQLRSSYLEFAGRLAEEWVKASHGEDFTEAISCLRQAIDVDMSIQDGRAYGIHLRMLGNMLIEAARPGEVRSLLEQAIPMSTGRNLARVYMVMARADIQLAALKPARAALDAAKAILHGDGATQYNWELEEREAELALAAKRFREARQRLAGLAEAAFNTGHPKAYRYLRQLEQLDPHGRR